MTRNFGRGIRSVMPRRLLLPVLVASALLSACPGEPPPEPADAGFSPFVLPTSADERSNVFPLIGRWYPVDEVKRLSDRTLTPEVWCEREPSKLTVSQDEAAIQCDTGPPLKAGIASVRSSTVAGELVMDFRVAKDFPMKMLRFSDRRGPSALIQGVPCHNGVATRYQRFPEYEILTRQILSGRRCSQLADTVEIE